MNREDEMKWLAGLKPGDCVGVANVRIARVERVTATLIVCDHGKFRRATGWRVTSDRFNRGWLHPVTDEMRERIYRERLVADLTRVDWARVPTGTLQQVAVLYSRAVACHE